MAANIPQLQQQQHQQQQTIHERYIPPPLDILPEQQEQHSPQQYPATNLHNYHANVFTTPGTATTASATTGVEPHLQQQQLQQHVAAASTNGIFENGKVRINCAPWGVLCLEIIAC